MISALRGLFIVSLIFSAPAFAQMVEIPPSTDQAIRISAFSGKPVPRFESLKYAAVHGRTGPSFEYPIAWRYERRGLPVMVIKESHDWRMVRDPSGDEVWMHARTLGGDPSVMIYGDDNAMLLRSADDDARVVAQVEPGAVAQLIGCEGSYCEVYLNHRRGWVAKSNLWGAPGTSPEPVRLQTAQLSSESIEEN